MSNAGKKAADILQDPGDKGEASMCQHSPAMRILRCRTGGWGLVGNKTNGGF